MRDHHLERFDRAQLLATPWKNGGGVTREIVRVPLGADMESFDWRVSIAEISADGEFSRFPGVDRVTVLLEGDGVHMDSVDHRLDTPLVPFSFSGDEPIAARLLGGTSTDFNVMTRRSSARAEVRVIRAAETLAVCGAGVLFAARGEWRAGEHMLAPNGGVWWDGTPLAWTLAPRGEHAALIAVTIT
jgi:uncharacterized protein